MDKATFDEMVERLRAGRTITMAGGKYPISDQHSANSAWKLRNHGKGVTEEQVVAHIRRACKELGLHFPGDVREKAAGALATFSRHQMSLRPHGFVFPAGMPPCSQCGEDPNMGAHVNPATAPMGMMFERRVVSADRHARPRLHRSHVYSTGYLGFHANIPCVACGNTMGAACHAPGMPCGSATGSPPGITPVAASVQRATLVTELNGRTLLTAQAGHSEQPQAGWEVAPQLAKSGTNPHFQWIEGAYVEAEQPNRNAAMWSTKDLEMGEPTVVNGPLNWLHEERHVIGAIAGAQLVHGQADGERAHIRTLSAMWSYLYPAEARQVAQASDEGKLWHSMECISREVSCLAEDCGHTMDYRSYMTDKDNRCEHVKAGGPRRFVEPTFLGSAVILGAVRPGWAGAHASVLREAAAAVETYEASLPGLTEEEATQVVAQLYVYSGVAA